MDWKKCLEENQARRSSKDKNRAKSLLKVSENRMNLIENTELTDSNALPLFSEAYEALLQVTQAIVSIKGYKIYNHICITEFLKEILDEHTIASKFDRYRKVRNSINYYGEEINKDFATEALKEIKDIVSKLKTKYLKFGN